MGGFLACFRGGLTEGIAVSDGSEAGGIKAEKAKGEGR